VSIRIEDCLFLGRDLFSNEYQLSPIGLLQVPEDELRTRASWRSCTARNSGATRLSGRQRAAFSKKL
jgi:hypothetical protein